jgi:hypothetical protein
MSPPCKSLDREGFPVNDIWLLTEIEKVLTAGCEE